MRTHGSRSTLAVTVAQVCAVGCVLVLAAQFWFRVSPPACVSAATPVPVAVGRRSDEELVSVSALRDVLAAFQQQQAQQQQQLLAQLGEQMLAARGGGGGVTATAGGGGAATRSKRSGLLCYSASGQPLRQFVFIKTHKTGSSTLTNLFYRATLKYRMRPLLNVGNVDYNWGYNIAEYRQHGFRSSLYYPPGTDGRGQQPKEKLAVGLVHFDNLFAGHSRYARPEMEQVVPNAKYITLLRDPYRQFVSAYKYWEISERVEKKMGSAITMEQFLEQPYHYRPYLEDFDYKLLFNGYAYDLGLDLGQVSDASIAELIARIDEEFALVMLTEFMAESLALLRRELCWDLEDVISVSLNVRVYQQKTQQLSEAVRAKIREHSPANVRLYEHFRSRFLERLKSEPELDEELAALRKIQEVGTACMAWLRTVDWGEDEVRQEMYGARLIDQQVPDDVRFCYLVALDTIPFSKFMKKTLGSDGRPNVPNLVVDHWLK